MTTAKPKFGDEITERALIGSALNIGVEARKTGTLAG